MRGGSPPSTEIRGNSKRTWEIQCLSSRLRRTRDDRCETCLNRKTNRKGCLSFASETAPLTSTLRSGTRAAPAVPRHVRQGQMALPGPILHDPVVLHAQPVTLFECLRPVDPVHVIDTLFLRHELIAVDHLRFEHAIMHRHVVLLRHPVLAFGRHWMHR